MNAVSFTPPNVNSLLCSDSTCCGLDSDIRDILAAPLLPNGQHRVVYTLDWFLVFIMLNS